MFKRSAFTLVELLIVVIILGILAAIVVPQFSDATSDTQVSSLRTNLATIRGQLELYRLQHNNTYPAVNTFSDQMTKKTDVDGTVNQANGKYGPYLQTVPVNPFNNSSVVTNNAAETTKGWYFDATSGVFKANDGGATNGVNHSDY
ncbi:MAG: prepilin-type N-terminal cleavage/methylation domain-containing protein [Phycisphaerae bacterium]|nr:prepilin-type N-terminal cleavage/methylation domain-containing protein [Phycisphaerae bacterium]